MISRPLSMISAGVLVLLMTACGGEQSPPSQEKSASDASTPAASPKTDTQTKKLANPYPEAVVKNFMASCVKGRGKEVEATCECTIQGIQNQYTLEDFKKVEADLSAGKDLPPDIVEIAKSCKSKTPQAENSTKGNSTEKGKQTETEASAEEKQPANSYPEKVVKNFIESCTQGGNAAKEKACGCMINKIQDEYTLDEFMQIDKDLGAGKEPSQEFKELLNSCVPKPN